MGNLIVAFRKYIWQRKHQEDVRVKIKAPFTDEQVVALNRWQAAGNVHPFTCTAHHTLVAHSYGWRCSMKGCEDYRQNWAWSFMLKEPPKLPWER
jgi:hypothetical protein